jgi:DNA-binding phage protein
VQRHVAADPAFGEALLREGIDTMLAGDVDTGKAILRDYIKATIGFDKLGEETGIHRTSLIRMFSPRGNPQARNLFSVLGYLQKRAGGRAARHGGAELTCARPPFGRLAHNFIFWKKSPILFQSCNRRSISGTL